MFTLSPEEWDQFQGEVTTVEAASLRSLDESLWLDGERMRESEDREAFYSEEYVPF